MALVSVEHKVTCATSLKHKYDAISHTLWKYGCSWDKGWGRPAVMPASLPLRSLFTFPTEVILYKFKMAWRILIETFSSDCTACFFGMLLPGVDGRSLVIRAWRPMIWTPSQIKGAISYKATTAGRSIMQHPLASQLPPILQPGLLTSMFPFENHESVSTKVHDRAVTLLPAEVWRTIHRLTWTQAERCRWVIECYFHHINSHLSWVFRPQCLWDFGSSVSPTEE